MSWNIGDNGNLFLKLKSKMDFIMLYLQLRILLSEKTYIDCSWNAAIGRHWKDWFQSRNILPKLYNV